MERKKMKAKTPAYVFERCPMCEAAVMKFEDEVFCDVCEWNSIGVHVESGGIGYFDLGRLDALATGGLQ